jgi:hypothetical protein
MSSENFFMLCLKFFKKIKSNETLYRKAFEKSNKKIFF